MKKLVACVLAAILLVLTPMNTAIAATEHPVSVMVDGVAISLDTWPVIMNDRVLVPLRGIFEALGATVLWNGETQTVTALRLDTVVKITIESTEASVNHENRMLDTPAKIIENRTFVPLRFVAESMGADVNWDGAMQMVTIDTGKEHWSDPGDNLSLNLLFTSEWIEIDQGEKRVFDPERFIQISDSWPDNPDGLFYSYSESNEPERNTIGIFADGAHLKDHYLEFDPETRILSEYMFDDIVGRWRKADEVTILFDFTLGSPVKNIRRETHTSSGDISEEEIARVMSEISGLDFFVTFDVVDGRLVADWAANSTLIAGLDDREQNEDFYFHDVDSLRWFMMDSLWLTLQIEEIYYTMDGGKELVLDGLYPEDSFPSDIPYMGTAFYFAHSSVMGDDADDTESFSYVDEEYGLILYYPSDFVPEPEDTDAVMMRFPSQNDNAVLQYWVIPNTNEETLDTFIESAPTKGIAVYNNVVIGWNDDLNQETGEVTPTAYFWVVEEDWIACVAISCETEEQAIQWCDRMIEENAVLIDRFGH